MHDENLPPLQWPYLRAEANFFEWRRDLPAIRCALTVTSEKFC